MTLVLLHDALSKGFSVSLAILALWALLGGGVAEPAPQRFGVRQFVTPMIERETGFARFPKRIFITDIPKMNDSLLTSGNIIQERHNHPFGEPVIDEVALAWPQRYIANNPHKANVELLGRLVSGIFAYSKSFEDNYFVRRCLTKVFDKQGCSRNAAIVRLLDTMRFNLDIRSKLTLRRVFGKSDLVASGIRSPAGVDGGSPREEGGKDSCNQGAYAHSKLPPDRRSRLVRIEGLIDGRLSCDTVAGNMWVGLGVTWFLCGLGAWGIWRLWHRRWISGLALVAVLVVGGPALFSLPG